MSGEQFLVGRTGGGKEGLLRASWAASRPESPVQLRMKGETRGTARRPSRRRRPRSYSKCHPGRLRSACLSSFVCWELRPLAFVLWRGGARRCPFAL